MARRSQIEGGIGVGARRVALAMGAIVAGAGLCGAERPQSESTARTVRLLDVSDLVIETSRPVSAPRRGFAPEQATGRPDVKQAGDNGAAWASQTPDGQREWLLCEYAAPIQARAIMVYETFNPGALIRVSAFNAAGDEIVAWEGEDPTPRTRPRGISVIPVKLDFPIQRIRLTIDSPAVPGWNEIDAVSIEDAGGTIHWAQQAEASSTFGAGSRGVQPANSKRAYSPDQVVGAPDTPRPGDQGTAWASASPDGQPEWLVCEYKNPNVPAEIVVYENNAPGAITRISTFDDAGKESTVWQGVDPTPRDQPWGVSVFPVSVKAPIRKLKLYINSHEFPGYNEIDAVGLRSISGDVEWASSAEASSVFGAGAPAMPGPQGMMPAPKPGEKTVQDLQKEIEGLRKQVDELQKLRQELKEIRDVLKDKAKPASDKP
ncbi:MAG: YtxH domain-containing protein [Planctomycetia bacterium]|nr:YtxH domain-containing protein [Planctomycetia bacterium]